MVSPVAPSPGLDTLLARPPTPPRERQANPSKLALTRHSRSSHLTLQTPPSHSPSSALSTNASSRRSRKRVEFTVQAEYCEPSPCPGRYNENQQSTPLSALSSIGPSKPLKSILKPASSPIPRNSLDPSAGHGEPGSTANLAAMLESTIKQLAGNDRDSRVDAYTMLVRALKTSTNVPDRIALQSKMSLFLQFIQRDITAKSGNKESDYSLANQALTLLCTFLHFPAIATAVNSDFGVFIMDHCIRSFEDYTIPKDVVRHLMQVVVCQNFSSKVMTADRVGRLIGALHHIEDHIKGKSIILSRILIYRKLIRQSAIHMVSHNEWLLDLFTDMLSSLKGIRTAAIALGLEASFGVAKETQVSKKAMEILQMSADETRYAEYYIQRLTAMTKERSEMAAVPQIWSIVILLLRCPIDRWEFFDQWLEIIQRCFNSGDYQTKMEANYAWNRLIYSLHLHESSFSKVIGTLCQPFNQLRRRGKQPDELRRVVIGGLCNLYYYAFKPKSSSTHVDHYWDVCVRTLIRTLAFPEADGKSGGKQQVSSIDNLSEAANILAGLFDSSNGRLWVEDRVAESPLAKPDELPSLDPKWIRRNTARVFAVVDPILQNSFLGLADPESSVSKLWRSLVGAIAAAAAKEVKVSTETAGFLGNALSLLMRIWAAGLGEVTASDASQQSFLKATEAYLTTMVLSIGHLPFTEKVLSSNKNDTLIPVATPSRRSGKGHGPTRSSLHHLFAMLSVLPPGVSESQDVSNLFRAVFGPFMLSRSPRAKRDLAEELMQISSPVGSVSYGPWVLIAEALTTPLDPSQSSHSSVDSISPPIGHEYRNVVKHLERGICNTPSLPWPEWLSLFNFLANQVTELSGEVGCSIVVIEPLAKAILESWGPKVESTSSNLYNCCTQLISRARQPRDRQALDFARKRLWGTTVAGARSASFDPFDSLYQLTSRILEILYATADSIDECVITSLISETSHFLARSNQVLVFKSLVLLQQGIGPWIQDADERYSGKHRSTVAEAVKLLWDRICNLFSDTTLENFQLDAIEQLLCSAFKSKHRFIVNSVVLVWNKGFENAGEVQYPETLKNVLLSLRSYVDISLPGLELSGYNTNASMPMLIDSQDDLDTTIPSRKPDQDIGSALNRPSSSGNLETPKSSRLSLSDHIKSGGPRSRPRSNKTTKRSKTPKLRHDDSQIQFALIDESSPSDQVMESQVLTNRQKEVRERQLENATLFPSIRSSPQKDNEVSIPTSHPIDSQKFDMISPALVGRSATPRGHRNYDYVSSTPTPRRGQPSMLDEDHEMTDEVPSSPPEPRRNLLPEMKSHSRDTHLLDDMPISSSPVPGSPVSRLASRLPVEQLVSQDGSVGNAAESMSSQHAGAGARRQITVVSLDMSADSSQEHVQSGSITGLMIQQPTPANPDSPQAHKEPRSDNEVFMDALTSPVPEGGPTCGFAAAPPNHGQQEGLESKDRSFDMSYDEERSMARLVIELDSRKCGPLSNHTVVFREKAPSQETISERMASFTGPERGQASAGEGKDTELGSPSADTDLSRSSAKKSQKKRKRGLEMKRNSSGKRRKNESQADDECAMSDQVSPRKASVTIGDKSPGNEGRRTSASLRGSPDLTCDPDNRSYAESLDLDEDSDIAAVNLQLITEASQQSDSDDYADLTDQDSPEPSVHETQPMAQDEETAEGKNKSKAEPAGGVVNKSASSQAEPTSVVDKITASLRDALEGLRTAKMSREDVYKIEDIFMDIKAELYGAEKRGRA